MRRMEKETGQEIDEATKEAIRKTMIDPSEHPPVVREVDPRTRHP
jgi:hypothetical protein